MLKINFITGLYIFPTTSAIPLSLVGATGLASWLLLVVVVVVLVLVLNLALKLVLTVSINFIALP